MAKKATQKASSTPSDTLELAGVEDLTAGVDLRRSPTLVQPTRSRMLRNVSLQEPGAWQPSPGWSMFSTTNLGAHRLQGADRIYLADLSPFLLAAYQGSVYKPTDSGVWGASVLTGLDPNAEVYFVYDRNLVAVYDGVHVPKKSVDGGTWTQFGITPPAAPSLSAPVASGSLVATHVYEVATTYVNSALAFESDGSPRSTTIPLVAPNLTVRVAVVASSDPQVDKVRVYARDVTAGESVLRRYSEVSNANQNVDITANTWSSALELPTDHGVAPAGRFAVVWRNRWWTADAVETNRLYFSQVFLPQAQPGLFYIDLPFERGDRITALIPLGDTLVVFGQTRVYLVIGQTSLDFEVRPSAGAVDGAFGPRACCVVEQGIVHAGSSGVLIFDGASDRLLSEDIDPGWRDAVQVGAAVDTARTALVYYPPRKEIHVTVSRLYPLGTTGEWVLDLTRTRQESFSAWTASTRDVAGYVLWGGSETVGSNTNRLLGWTRGTGELTEELVGTSANGSDLTCEYRGPSLVPAPRKMARFITLELEYQPAAGLLGGEVTVDEVSVSSFTIPPATDASLWGTGVWGTFVWGSAGRRYISFDLPLEAEGRSIGIALKYIGQSVPKVFTYAVTLRPEPALRGL